MLQFIENSMQALNIFRLATLLIIQLSLNMFANELLSVHSTYRDRVDRDGLIGKLKARGSIIYIERDHVTYLRPQGHFYIVLTTSLINVYFWSSTWPIFVRFVLNE